MGGLWDDLALDELRGVRRRCRHVFKAACSAQGRQDTEEADEAEAGGSSDGANPAPTISFRCGRRCSLTNSANLRSMVSGNANRIGDGN
jgi:hypothetical protein